ncbi:ead/Ea22-like family protein [Citrobacter braakii]|nr:ead/Ea22-like family protein [Citrobacter braakii]
MTALNKQALRQLAEKATPGPWEMEHENIWFRDTEGYTKHLMYAYQGDDVDDQQDHDNTAYIAAFNPKVVLALLDELEAANKAAESGIEWMKRCLAAEKRIAELTEALKQSTEGYKSCLRMGYDRIVDLGGDCDEPKVMINNNPDIQQSEKLLSAGIITKVGE